MKLLQNADENEQTASQLLALELSAPSRDDTANPA